MSVLVRSLWSIVGFLLVVPPAYSASVLPLNTIKLPPGFSISIYARDVPDARSMTLSPNGTLFVGTRKAGKVYAIRARDQARGADTVTTIALGLHMPNGVVFHDGALYVAEVNRILRYDNIEARLTAPPPPVVITDSYPRETHHGWKFIRLGPDGLLYVPVGAPCNVCQRSDARYASITRLKLDGTGFEVVAQGVRNTVGFDWHPETKELWFTDNGRDLLGDDVPPDELNHAPKPGLHFGFPYCHGKDILDPEFGTKRPCGDFVPPVLALGPHVAALGMRFYTMIRQKANTEEPRCWYDHRQRYSREEGDDHAIPVARRRGVYRSRIKRSGAMVPEVRGAAHGV